MPLFRAHLCTSFHAQIFLSSAVLSMIYPLLPQQYLPLRSNTPTTGFTISLKSSWSLTTPPYQPSRRAVLDMRAFTPSTNAKNCKHWQTDDSQPVHRRRSTKEQQATYPDDSPPTQEPSAPYTKGYTRRKPATRHRHHAGARPGYTRRTPTYRHTAGALPRLQALSESPSSSRASGTIPLSSSRVTPANIKSGLHM